MRRFAFKPDLSHLPAEEREQIYAHCGKAMMRYTPRWASIGCLVGAVIGAAVVRDSPGMRAWPVQIMVVVLVVLAAVSFALAIGWVSAAASYVPLLREELRRRGFCANCGYDLRETPDRCPECGARRAG